MLWSETLTYTREIGIDPCKLIRLGHLFLNGVSVLDICICVDTRRILIGEVFNSKKYLLDF